MSRSAEPLPVFSAAEMRAFEAAALGAQGSADERVVLESAGRAVASAVESMYPDGRIAVVFGSGNNGGDAVVAARTLAARGRDVVLISGSGADVPEGLLHGWRLPQAELDALAGADVIVDGLLGTGAAGPLRGSVPAAVAAINAAAARVVAVDAPTGADMTSGAVAEAAVRADVTVTFGGLKLGHLFFPGCEYCGEVLLAEVGFPPVPAEAAGAWLITDAWARTRLPRQAPDVHKGEAGLVGVVAGRTGVGGAAIMAAEGALRAGAGGVLVVSTESNRVAVHAAVPEAVFVDRESAGLADELARCSALLIGPGMGTDAAAGRLLQSILGTYDGPLLLDADALTLVAQGLVRAQGGGGREILFTPHPGELGRLLGESTQAVLEDRQAAARRVAAEFGVAVLAKGAPSLVTAPDGRSLVSVAGHSGVATGGMGDTLGGVAAAFLARGVEARTAGGLALHYAGRAAEVAGRGRGLLPRDVANALPAALLGDAGESLNDPFIYRLPAPY